jgi:hypothetical protein
MTLLTTGYALFQRQNAMRRSREADKQRAKATSLRDVADRKTAETNRLLEESEVDRNIILGRNLAASSLKYKNSKLDLMLLLNLEAGQIAEEIRPKTPQQAKARVGLLAQAKGGLLGGLVSSPHLRTFLQGHTDPQDRRIQP